MARILVVEDDPEIAMLESDYLEINNYDVEVLSDGLEAVSEACSGKYDLILLDVMLPGQNGYEICKSIRSKIDIPILMVTAKTESIDKIRGLGLGADDYISKPFDPAELIARVKSHISRYNRLLKKTADEEIIHVGDIKILSKSWKVYKGSSEIKFTNKEFELLKFLASNANIVFSKEQLFEKIWGFDYMGDSATVIVHINRIREKLGDSKEISLIETIWGAGYRLNI
ncbi:response regulator transcription factor [Acidaminobacter sp. JC074]|uniref:response regulator transcription factor n=1 Tax=Acidaminobacter sp. JC074 TaxID=2530199 RepID=UPI001F0ED01F|nr:response regulator transcription factor [Acidaminobacter sp. JC074]MCH4889583.1 response regulator transcription factor [Acidaminobacter sp. JC074]